MGKVIIRNNIRKLRFFAGEMTQQELADNTGVSRQTIVAIENGKYFPTLELAFRIAHTFKVPLEEVFTFELIPEPDNKDQKVKNINPYSELEAGIFAALETYANVYRGSGHHSLTTTHLFEKARAIVLEYHCKTANEGVYQVEGTEGFPI